MRATRPPRNRTRSTAKISRKGQTGLSVAFDLPTQTGYDADHPLARGEVGKVGVSICHLGDMRALFEQIPLAAMNTSMTINATAAWLLALYIAVADEQGASRKDLTGTTQNDIIKEYLSRGTYVFPPGPSHAAHQGHDPVHDQASAEVESDECLLLSSAGGGRDAGAGARLCARHRDRGPRCGEGIRRNVDEAQFGEVVGRISFFVNAGLRFITELCKMRAFAELWDEITAERYGITDAKQRLFRYGVQVNSLGLTEQQPENNVYRILIEMLAVTLSARPAPAPCSCRPGTRRSACRGRGISNGRCACSRFSPTRPISSSTATSSTGSTEIEHKVAALKREARQELDAILAWAARSPRSKTAT